MVISVLNISVWINIQDIEIDIDIEIQLKNDNSYCFGCTTFFSFSMYSLKTKILIRNGIILILKSILKACCVYKMFQSKAYLSRLNIKQNTKDLSVLIFFWHLWCSNDLIHSYCCPNTNLVLGPGICYPIKFSSLFENVWKL